MSSSSPPDDRDGVEKAFDSIGNSFSKLSKLFRASALDVNNKFFLAIKRDDEKTLREMLQAGFDPNAFNARGQRGLHVAATSNAAKCAAVLIEYNADPLLGMKDEPNHTPMEDAVKFVKPEVALILLQAGGYPRDARVMGLPLLHHSCTRDHNIALALIAGGLDANETTENGSTPLMTAIFYHMENLALSLLDNPAVVQGIEKHFAQTDKEKRTAFALAIDLKIIPVIAKMIEMGANANARGANGKTLMAHAIEGGNHEIIGMLAAAGADLNAFAIDHADNPLRQVMLCNQHSLRQQIDLLLLLVELGANPEMALIMAAPFYSRPFIFELIDKTHADINGCDPKTGRTALIEAARANNLGAVELLVEMGADASICDKDGKSARDYALDYQYPKILRLLPGKNNSSQPPPFPQRGV